MAALYYRACIRPAGHPLLVRYILWMNSQNINPAPLENICKSAPGDAGEISILPGSILSCVLYTRVLTWVQLTSGREPSSNPPMDVG